MFSYAPSFSACAGRTAAPLPLACVCTDAMVVEMEYDPSSQLSSIEALAIAASLCIHVYPAALTAESGGSYARSADAQSARQQVLVWDDVQRSKVQRWA